MALNVLIVPDKFKGTLTAIEATEAIASGWATQRPMDHVEFLPMSDGGDGFGEVLGRILKAEKREVATVDAAHRPHTGHWWWEPDTRTAIVETAQVIGLALLPRGRFHPFQLDTYGLGKVFEAVAAENPRSCLVGIGGSATNDGGFGMARALGYKFIHSEGGEIESWTDLNSLAQIVPPESIVNLGRLLVAVDVQNPLLGAHGATRIYGPQKGLSGDDFNLAEMCLEQLAFVARTQFVVDYSIEPGAGAAGGLGFGLRAFLSGEFQSGFKLFSQFAQLEHRLREADLVLTGEGCLDESTLMGKGVGALANLCYSLGLPCIGLGGTILDRVRPQLSGSFTHLYAIHPDLASGEQARQMPVPLLQQLAGLAAQNWTTQYEA